jgi:hypothetical protein
MKLPPFGFAMYPYNVLETFMCLMPLSIRAMSENDHYYISILAVMM